MPASSLLLEHPVDLLFQPLFIVWNVRCSGGLVPADTYITNQQRNRQSISHLCGIQTCNLQLTWLALYLLKPPRQQLSTESVYRLGVLIHIGTTIQLKLTNRRTIILYMCKHIYMKHLTRGS